MDQSADRTLIPMEVVDEILRPQMLRTKQICRLCLAQDVPLSPIFPSAGGAINKTTQPPVSMQIMACFSIEIYSGDGMPGMICGNCQVLLNHCYHFRQFCKNADTQLKLFLTTGIWPEKLQLPTELLNLVSSPRKGPQQRPAPHSYTKSGTQIATPVTPDSEKEKGRKINIIKLSPSDLKNIRMVNRVTVGSSPESSPIVPVRKESPAPLLTSTPMANRAPPAKTILNRQGSRLQLHEQSNGSPIPRQTTGQNTPAAKETKSPVILNKLAGSSYSRPSVKEEFVSTGDGTVMILNYEPEPPVAVNTGAIFPCTECSRTFKLKQLLDLHKLNHKRERNFPCTECNKRFYSKYDLAKHMSTHTGERPYVCVICMAAFSRSTLLTRHQASHKDDLTHPCMFCSRVFVSQEELTKHALTHEKHRPFQCGMCSKSFAYKQGLERHAVMHADVLPHKCEYCAMSFHTSAMLSRHLTAHAGDRPYPCRLCKKSFLLSHHLSRHLRSHNTAEPSEYTCNGCKQSFTTMHELIYHSAGHAKNDLECPLCREQFFQEDAVDEHIEQHAKSHQFACDYCDLMYTSEEALATHCQEYHVDELAYEWSEAQHKQLAVEQEEQARKAEAEGGEENAKRSDEPDSTQIVIAGEEVDSNVLLDEDTIQHEIEHVILQNEDQNTEVFVDQFGNEQEVETFEVTEYVDMLPNDDDTSPEKKTETPPPPPPPPQPAKPVAAAVVKQESPEPSKSVARQKSAEEFYQRNKLAVEKKTAQRKVSDMLKRLPKGVTIKRELPGQATSAPGNPTHDKPTPAAGEKRNPDVVIPVEKAKPAATQAPAAKGASPGDAVKRKPGRPPKAVPVPEKERESEVKKENVATKRTRPEERKEEGKPLTKPQGVAVAKKTELPDKKSIVDGGLKRSGTMNFPKSRVGIDGPPSSSSAASSASSLSSGKASTQMVRRSYAAPSKASSVGVKRAAEKDATEEESAVPSKRAVPSVPTRKTLNPAMLSSATVSNAKPKPTMGSAKASSGETGKPVNVLRAIKRVPNADSTVGAPVEMNVGGKTIKMQKLILTKEEALALQKAGKLKPTA